MKVVVLYLNLDLDQYQGENWDGKGVKIIQKRIINPQHSLALETC